MIFNKKTCQLWCNTLQQKLTPHLSILLCTAALIGILSLKYIGLIIIFAPLTGIIVLVTLFQKNTHAVLYWLLLCLTLLFFYLYASYYDHHPIRKASSQTFTGKLIDQPHYRAPYWHFSLHALDHSERYVSKYKAPHFPYHYGDILKVEGKFQEIQPVSNPGQFDYRNYLKVKRYDGVFKINNLRFIKKGRKNPVKTIAFKLKEKVLDMHRKTLPHPFSELYIGLLIGDHGTTLPKDIEERFQRTGLIHLLVVSGAQVSLISGITHQFLAQCRLPFRWLYAIISLINLIFYFITGGGASILRAIIMNQLLSLTKGLKRKASPVHILSVTALIMLFINPLYLFDVGALLSFFATFSLLYVVPEIETFFPQKWPPIIKQTFSVTLAPFLLTSPIILFFFNSISPITLLSNLLVVMWIECIVVIGFISTLVGFIWLPLTQIINHTSWVCMKILMGIVGAVEKVPIQHYHVSTNQRFSIILLYTSVVLSVYYFRTLSKKSKRILIVTNISLFLILFLPLWVRKPYLELMFLDVGQGDATIIKTPYRKVLLIDGGNRLIDFKTGKPYFDAGKRVVAPALRHWGINRLDVAMISHFHRDHSGGIPYILETIPSIAVIDNNNATPQKNKRYLSALHQHQINRYNARKIKRYALDKETTLTFFYPSPHDVRKENENNNSIVCQLRYKEITVLFTGDLEEEIETDLVSRYGKHLRSSILKVGHHGSKTSSTVPFLNQVRPLISIISVGKKNRYRHPSSDVIQRLEALGSTVFRTDKHGAIHIKSDGKKLWVKHYLKRQK